MQMRHGFSAVGAVVDHEPKAGLTQSFFLGDGLRDVKQMAQQWLVGGDGCANPGDFFFWHDQAMGACGFTS